MLQQHDSKESQQSDPGGGEGPRALFFLKCLKLILFSCLVCFLVSILFILFFFVAFVSLPQQHYTF